MEMMRTEAIRRLTATVVLSVTAAGISALAVAPALAQTHDHGTAAPAKARLEASRKWSTDAPLRDGMTRIRALVEPQLAPAHAGKLNAAQYAALASRIETEVGGIVANCKLEPQADAALHAVIAEIGAGTDAMAGKTAQQRPAQGLVHVAKAVNDYAALFEHAGFKLIRNVH
jgi:hypothetical protein